MNFNHRSFFTKDKHKLHVLDSPSPLQSLLSTTPRIYLVPPPKSVQMYRHTVMWLPNFLGWIGHQIVLAMGLRLHALHAFVELCFKFTCEISKLPWQSLVDTAVSTWLTLNQHVTSTQLTHGSICRPTLSWYVDRYFVLNNHLVSSVGRAPVCWVEVGRGFKPWLDQRSGSLNNWEETAAFVMTSANG